MRLPIPPERYEELYERERNRAIEAADFENVKLRTFDNALRWATINGLMPTYNVKHFGAKGDGITDDTAAILAAVAGGIDNNIPVLFPSGSFLISSPITDAAGRVVLIFGGGHTNTILRWNGDADTWVIDFTSYKSEVYGSGIITGHTSGKDYTWNGIRCSSNANNVQVHDGVQLYKCKNGVKLSTVYGCQIKASPNGCTGIGVDFDSQANSNVVDCSDGIFGKSGAEYGTTGVRNTGQLNICKGMELQYWTTGYYGDALSSGSMLGHFVENNTVSVQLVAPASVDWNCNGWLGRVIVPDGATLRTPWGHISPVGLQTVPKTLVPSRGLSVYHPMHTTGAASHSLADYSGNGRNTVAGSGTWAWTSGPYKYAIQLAGGAANTICLDPTAITYNGAWSCAILCRATSWNSNDKKTVLTVYENSNKIEVFLTKDVYYISVYRNGVALISMPAPYITTDDWTWACLGYDPSGGGNLYNLSPVSFTEDLGDPTVCSNPFTGAITKIELGDNGAGALEVGSIAIWNGRVLSKTEMLYWCNQTIQPNVPQAILNQGGGVWRFGDYPTYGTMSVEAVGSGRFRAHQFAVDNDTGSVNVRNAADSSDAGRFNATSADNVQLQCLGSGKNLQMVVSATGAVQVVRGSYAAGLYAGTGSPESAVSATVGSVYFRTDGGAGTSFYVKESGTGNTGWVAK